MGHKIFQQPDGLWAIWSTTTDSFIKKNLMKQEVKKHYMERAKERASRRVDRQFRKIEEGERIKSHPETYQDALEWQEKVNS